MTTEAYGVVSYTKTIMTYMQLFVDFGFMLSGTKDIIKALHKLHYFEIQKWGQTNELGISDYFMSGIHEMDFDEYKVDNFGIFMFLYGETIDKEAILNGE